ncbi:MAG: hypothetical protein IPJ87_16585 [Flavobacteriales bacterium]|nr:hypothetical protein [Flavobacteriales bacterium]MBK7943466.1 hypothetical protein [Flavobacteriales bacterium]MBK9699845.1 hypothetical protein [Flavobacteriales bacterium]
MKLRTASAALDKIDGEFAWRLKEIADLKLQTSLSIGDRRKTIIRSGVPLLYAHWEGFVKASAQHFINFVSNQAITYRELAPCFVVRSLRGHISGLSGPGSYAQAIAGVQHLLASLNQPSQLSPNSPVATHSNLNSERFVELALSIGIDTAPYSAKWNLIDVRLLRCRNMIAHGEYLEIDHGAFITLCNDVIPLLRQFKNDLENAIMLKKYVVVAA